MTVSAKPATSAATGPAVATRAPDFVLDSSGGPLALTDAAGLKLVLYFYPRDDTPGCTTEAIDFSALGADLTAADTMVIGVSRDSVAAHGKFAAKHGLGVALGADTTGAVTEAYGVWVEKSMYGRTSMGIERATFLIDRTGTVAAVWRKVKVAGHAQAVLDAARLLP
jgi:thioredoxin-dependent peroxiredoxin